MNVELEVYLQVISDNAYGVYENVPEFGIEQELIWIPKSEVESDNITETDSLVTIEIPEWLATEKGLV